MDGGIRLFSAFYTNVRPLRMMVCSDRHSKSKPSILPHRTGLARETPAVPVFPAGLSILFIAVAATSSLAAFLTKG